MTGSDGQAGRRSRTPCDPFSDAAQCFVCRRERPAASCEAWERVEASFKGREPGRVMWGCPERLRVCKDCCIAALGGHRCKWWHLCWGEYPGEQ